MHIVFGLCKNPSPLQTHDLAVPAEGILHTSDTTTTSKDSSIAKSPSDTSTNRETCTAYRARIARSSASTIPLWRRLQIGMWAPTASCSTFRVESRSIPTYLMTSQSPNIVPRGTGGEPTRRTHMETTHTQINAFYVDILHEQDRLRLIEESL